MVVRLLGGGEIRSGRMGDRVMAMLLVERDGGHGSL